MKQTLKILKKYFSLVLPFLWKDRYCALSTSITALLTLVDVLVAPLAPWLFSELIRHNQGDIVPHRWGLSLGQLAIGLSICWLLNKTIKRLRSIVFFHVANQAIRSIRLQLITHFHHIALRGGLKYDTREILSASTRVSLSIRFCLRIAFLSFIPAIFKLIVSALAVQYVVAGSQYFFIGIALTYIYVFYAIRKFVRIHHHVWETSDRVMVAMGDSLQQRDFAKLHPEEEEKRLTTFFDQESKGWWQEHIAHHTIHLVQNMLFFLMTGFFFIYLIGLLRQGKLDVSQLVLLQGYIMVIHQQVFNLTEYIRGTSAYVVDMKKVLDIFSLTTDKQQGRSQQEIAFSSEKPVFKLENLSFHYPKVTQQAIRNVSMTIKQGHKVAITGASGSGKSTLARLLAGIYLPSQGEVIFKGHATHQLSPASMGKHLYFIGQDDPLIAGSIQDNLMLEVPQELDPLSYLQEILNHKTQEKQLSGGERQRVLLSRCLSYRPEVVVLDEALSYLDTANGRLLLNMVLQKVPTVILLTHRQEFLDQMERVYHLQEGMLVLQKHDQR